MLSSIPVIPAPQATAYWAKHLNSQDPNSQGLWDSDIQNCPACKGQASWYTDLVGPRPLAGTRPWHMFPPFWPDSPLGFLLQKCRWSADGKFAKGRMGSLLQLSEWRGCWQGPGTTNHAVLLSAHGIEMRGFQFLSPRKKTAVTWIPPELLTQAPGSPESSWDYWSSWKQRYILITLLWGFSYALISIPTSFS